MHTHKILINTRIQRVLANYCHFCTLCKLMTVETDLLNEYPYHNSLLSLTYCGIKQIPQGTLYHLIRKHFGVIKCFSVKSMLHVHVNANGYPIPQHSFGQSFDS